MRLDEALKLSDKVRRSSWDSKGAYISLPTRYEFSKEDLLADDWEPLTEKKNVTVYPALCRGINAGFYISELLFKNEDDAKEELHYEFIKLLTDRGVEVEVE